jgi:hypothetical protein
MATMTRGFVRQSQVTARVLADFHEFTIVNSLYSLSSVIIYSLRCIRWEGRECTSRPDTPVSG